MDTIVACDIEERRPTRFVIVFEHVPDWKEQTYEAKTDHDARKSFYQSCLVLCLAALVELCVAYALPTHPILSRRPAGNIVNKINGILSFKVSDKNKRLRTKYQAFLANRR